jgi:hypothetical protein
MGLGLSGMLLLGAGARSTEPEKRAKEAPVLEIIGLDRGNYTLGLSWPWGAMAVDHVLFNDHSGPFKAIVESSGKGVRVTFDGWGRLPFVASAAKMRIIYWVADRKEIDFKAEAIAGGTVRVQPVDRPVSQGKRIIIGLGPRAANGVGNVSVEGPTD